jgi:hypothetical protein
MFCKLSGSDAIDLYLFCKVDISDIRSDLGCLMILFQLQRLRSIKWDGKEVVILQLKVLSWHLPGRI